MVAMWSEFLMKNLPQLLVELIPHVQRALPRGDRALAAKSAADDTKLDELAASLRGDMGKVAKAHIALAEQLDAFSAHVGEGAAEAKRARMAAELAQAKVEALEKQVAGLRTLVVFVLVVVGLVFLLVLLAFVLALRSH